MYKIRYSIKCWHTCLASQRCCVSKHMCRFAHVALMPSSYWSKPTIIISVQNRNVPVMSYFEADSHSLNHQCVKINVWIQCLIALYSNAVTNSTHQRDMVTLSAHWDKGNKQFNHQPETIRWRYSISIHWWPDALFEKRWPHPLHSSIALNRSISDRRAPSSLCLAGAAHSLWSWVGHVCNDVMLGVRGTRGVTLRC